MSKNVDDEVSSGVVSWIIRRGIIERVRLNENLTALFDGAIISTAWYLAKIALKGAQ